MLAAAFQHTTARVRFAPLGPAAALSLLLGALLVLRLEALPDSRLLAAGVALGGLLWFARSGPLRLLGAALFGAGWLLLTAAWVLADRLPDALVGEDLRVEGRVIGLPESGERQQRFLFEVQSGEAEASALAGTRLRLSWFGPAQALRPGQVWPLEVRLRRPRGVLNPAGHDFERRALERRIAATGYVRRALAEEPLRVEAGLDGWRMQRSDALAASISAPGVRFVQALALGDTRGLGERDWEVLRATGLTHLLAISGYHIGVVAGFAALLAGLFYRAWPRIGLYLPRPQGAALMALLAATSYAAAAGFSLPTLRALLMVAAVLSARLLRRPGSPGQSLALALIVLLLFDPLSLLAPGFWLSFLGVAWLLWCLPRGSGAPPWRVLLTAQLVAAIGLLPLTIWFFGQASVIGPIANLIGIPLISLVVVPLSLLSLAGVAIGVPAAGLPGALAAWTMDICMPWMDRAASLEGALVWLPEASLPAILLAFGGAFWLLLPRAVPGKSLALLLFLPLLWPAQQALKRGEAEIWLFDVGQGLSLLVRTAEHALLYDAGPSYAGGLDMGESAVVPALRGLGVKRLDAFVISHGDNDHAGGAAAVQRALAPTLSYAPNGWQPGSHALCEAGLAWQWDEVRFVFLHPSPHFPYLGNDSSCVLRIDTASTSILLSGDISEVVEQRLLRDAADELDVDWLLVPHHGSRSSSSEAFIDAVSPRLALVAVAHGSRFGHPHAEVVERYRQRGIRLLSTAESGALSLRLDESDRVEGRRETHRRFWHEP